MIERTGPYIDNSPLCMVAKQRFLPKMRLAYYKLPWPWPGFLVLVDGGIRMP